jgi:hypothetical protein
MIRSRTVFISAAPESSAVFLRPGLRAIGFSSPVEVGIFAQIKAPIQPSFHRHLVRA